MSQISQKDIKGIYVGGIKVRQICLGDQSIFPMFPKPLEKVLSELYAPSEPIVQDEQNIDLELIERFSRQVIAMSNMEAVEIEEIPQQQQGFLDQLSDVLVQEDDDINQNSMAELSNWIAETSNEEGENIEELSQEGQEFLTLLSDVLFDEDGED